MLLPYCFIPAKMAIRKDCYRYTLMSWSINITLSTGFFHYMVNCGHKSLLITDRYVSNRMHWPRSVSILRQESLCEVHTCSQARSRRKGSVACTWPLRPPASWPSAKPRKRSPGSSKRNLCDWSVVLFVCVGECVCVCACPC